MESARLIGARRQKRPPTGLPQMQLPQTTLIAPPKDILDFCLTKGF
jgi:hypothetical protein